MTPKLRILLTDLIHCYYRAYQWENQLKFGGNLVPDIGFWITFHFPYIAELDPTDARIRINPEIRIRIHDHFWLKQPKFKCSGALGVGGGRPMRCQSTP